MTDSKLSKLSKGHVGKKWGKWTNEDILLLQKLFQVLTAKEIAQIFDLSLAEVRGALSYRVAPTKIKKVVWTEDRLNYLKDYYGKIPIEELATSLGCSVAGIHHKASRLGIKPHVNDAFEDKNRLWKLVSNFENYEISNDGLVRNKNTNRLLTPVLKNHYYSVRLSKNGSIQSKSLHRLIAEAFLGDATGMEVNHIDGNPTNNTLTNLEILDKDAHKIHTRLLRKYVGNQVNTAVLNPKTVREMRELYSRGGVTYAQISKSYGVNKSTARRAINGEYWKQVD